MEKLGARRTPRPAKGLRRFLPINVYQGPSGWTVKIHWRKLLAAVFALSLFGWLAAATTVFAWAKYRQDIPDVRWGDIALPNRWDHFRHAQGRALLKNAKDSLEAGEFAVGFHQLRVGLAKAPEDREGRLLLAQIYAASRRPDLAERTLLAGVPFLGHEPEFLRALFSFMLSRQHDEQVIDTAQRLLHDRPADDATTPLIATAAATASYFRGNFDKAEDYLRRFKLERSREGVLLAAKIDWERGYRDLALMQINRLYDQRPDDDEIYTTYVTWLRELGRDNIARQTSLSRQIAFPDNPRPRVDLLYAYDREGLEDRVNGTAASIFNDFADKPDALLALADFAANTGRPEIARKVFEISRARDLPWEGPALMSMESLVVAGKYQAAIELSQKLLAENPAWAEKFYSVFNGLQAIAYFGLDDRESGQLFLNNFLAQPNIRAENLIAVSKRLITVGARAQARDVLARAINSDPLNQPALSQLIQLDLAASELETVPANLRRLLSMRKPNEAIVREAYQRLGSDYLLFLPGRAEILDEVAQFLGGRTG